VAVIANLELKLRRRCLPDGHLARLTEISRTVWERTNLIPPTNQPFTGRAAFAHKGGIHVSAVQRNSATYEHVVPEVVGNERRILISELSGRSNVQAKLAAKYPQLQDAAMTKSVLDTIVERENAGYSYEAAEASFELVVRRAIGVLPARFHLVHYRIHGLGTPGDAKDLVEATVKVTVAEDTRLTVSEGHGPVDALSHALRQALEPSFPQLAHLMLSDYKVRVVNSSDGTAAKVRVLIEHRWQGRTLGTVGVSENIIEASWEALVEAVEYALADEAG
jgi:2-isopropylmalate synthase